MSIASIVDRKPDRLQCPGRFWHRVLESAEGARCEVRGSVAVLCDRSLSSVPDAEGVSRSPDRAQVSLVGLVRLIASPP